MDKQKQIEEMAKEVEKSYTAYRGFCPHKPTVCSTIKSCVYCNIATHLIEQGYRKITEGAVVLTREEYDELQVGKDFNYGYHSGEINMTAYYENIRLPELRKETAEKFAEKLKEKLEERKKLCLERWERYENEGEGELACYWNGKENEIHCVKADIYEICKEITEGKV